MNSKRNSEWWRIAVGAAAVAGLVSLCWLLPRGAGIREQAVVEAARTFTLATPLPGEYTWNLLTALPARNETAVRQRHMQFDRGELVELELAADLVTGAEVDLGQRLATIGSPALVRELRELIAGRDALVAQLALLRAGGRPEEVVEAKRKLELAEALRAGERPNLERTRSLHRDTMISDAEMELVELQDESRRLEVELARAQLQVISGPARPEALDALGAQIAVLDAGIEELETRAEELVVRAPIKGILEMGGSTNILEVYDLETVHLRIPLSQGARYRIEVGSTVRFSTAACPGELFDGVIVELGENGINLNGRQVFWASARVDNPDRLLRSGMTGDVEIAAAVSGSGLIRSLWQEIVEVGL